MAPKGADLLAQIEVDDTWPIIVEEGLQKLFIYAGATPTMVHMKF